MESPDQLMGFMLNKQQDDDMWFETSVIAAKRLAIQTLRNLLLNGFDKKRAREKAEWSDSDDVLAQTRR
jgi:hypothetical protein